MVPPLKMDATNARTTRGTDLRIVSDLSALPLMPVRGS
jgi:hypothetical protein